MTDTDFAPSTVLITAASLKGNIATLAAVNEDGQNFIVSLDVTPYFGAKRWFFATIDNHLIINETPYPLTSVYDTECDEWFTTAGNYGIHSRDLQFTLVGDKTGA